MNLIFKRVLRRRAHQMVMSRLVVQLQPPIM